MDLLKEYACLSKNKCVCQKILTVDKNYQESIEEYLDDLFKIIKCDCHSFVTSCDIFNDCVTVNGKTEVCLTYQNAENKICYTDFIEDFEEKIVVKDLSDSAFVSTNIFDKYCSYRVINERKIDFHISVEVDVFVYDKVSYPCISKCENSKLKIKNKSISNIINSHIVKLDFDEGFTLPSSNKDIKSIITFDTTSIITEIKSINNKILCKAKIEFNLLYINDNDECDKAVFAFETSKIIDSAGVDENSVTIAKIKSGAVYVKNKNQCEIQFYGDCYCYLDVFGLVEQNIVTDGYLLNSKCECKFVNYDCNIDCNYDVNDIKKSIEIELTEPLSKINTLHIYCSKIYSNKVCFNISILGLNEQSVLCCNTYTNEIEIDYKDVISSTVKILNYDYNFINEKKLNINLSFEYCNFSGKQKEYKILSDISFVQKNENSPALTLYFGKSKEKIWTIAKKFTSDVELIKNENNLKSDVLDSNKVLIIPGL